MRAGMTTIVSYLRQYGQVGVDEEFNGQSYWSDDQLEDIADTWAYRVRFPLIPAQAVARTDFVLDAPRSYMFDTGALSVIDDTGSTVSTAYTYDPAMREFIFVSELSDVQHYAEGRAVNLNEALADVWGLKAQMRYDYIDFKASNDTLKLSQEYEHCLKMRDYYRARIIRRHGRERNSRWLTS